MMKAAADTQSRKQQVAGSDFNRGPESFTTATPYQVVGRTQVGSVSHHLVRGGEKTNDSGDAIASNLTHGGSPQDV